MRSQAEPGHESDGEKMKRLSGTAITGAMAPCSLYDIKSAVQHEKWCSLLRIKHFRRPDYAGIKTLVLNHSFQGILKLEHYFQTTSYTEYVQITGFLKNIQTLLSTGSGHRKGSEYNKALKRPGRDISRKQDAFGPLLNRANDALRAIRAFGLIDPK